MIDPAEMAERHARILKRLTEFGDAVVEQSFDDVIAAPTPEAREPRARIFHTLSHGLRQTLALEASFERNARRAALETRHEAERRTDRMTKIRQTLRKADVRRTVERLVWNDWNLSGFRADRVLMDADRRLIGDLDLDEPLDDQIIHLCRRLGFNPKGIRPSADDEDEDGVDDQEDAGDEAAATASPTPAPSPNPDPFNGRLAPPMDLPSWIDSS